MYVHAQQECRLSGLPRCAGGCRTLPWCVTSRDNFRLHIRDDILERVEQKNRLWPVTHGYTEVNTVCLGETKAIKNKILY